MERLARCYFYYSFLRQGLTLKSWLALELFICLPQPAGIKGVSSPLPAQTIFHIYNLVAQLSQNHRYIAC